MNTQLTNRTAESVYLEYLNDFLTVSRMAEYYNIKEEELNALIDKGRDEHIQKFNLNKLHHTSNTRTN